MESNVLIIILFTELTEIGKREQLTFYCAQENMWCYSRDNLMSLIKVRLYDCALKALAQF